MRRIVTALLVGAFALAISVQAKDAERQALAEQLLVGMEMQKTLDKSFEMVKQMIPTQMTQMGVPDDVLSDEAQGVMEKTMDVMMKEMSWDKLKGDYISIYAETFTAEELKGLVQFYESPIGKKFIEKQPELMQRSMQISQKQMLTIMPKIQDLMLQSNLQESSLLTQGSGKKKRKPGLRLPVDQAAFAARGPDSTKFSDLTLSDDPKPDEVKKYICDIVNASHGQRSFSDRDPQVALLTRVGRQNLPLLIEALSSSGPMNNFHIQRAILSLTDGDSKALILDSLPIHQNLVEAVIQHGWEEDAKAILLTELKSNRQYLPPQWIQAVANLNAPESYSLLRDYFIYGQNPSSTYDAIKHLPIKDMDEAVNEAWQKKKDADEYSRISMAIIAVKHGCLDALGATIDSLASVGPDNQWLNREARQTVLQHTNFRGSNAELEVWFKTNRDRLKFDSKTAKFIVSTEVDPSA